MKKNAKRILNLLQKSNSGKEIYDFINSEFAGKKDKSKYPFLPFNINKDEIKILKNEGFITEENYFNVERFTNATALEKLLFSVIWKQGDLKKIVKILDGIEENKYPNERDYITFYQFGRYLTSPRENVIIDQHVIRAYSFLKHHENDDILPKILKKNILLGKDKSLVEDYISWLKNSSQINNNLKKEENYFEFMDDLLFVFGAYLKKENHIQKSVK